MHHPREKETRQSRNDHRRVLPQFTESEEEREIENLENEISPVMIDLSPQIRKSFREKEILENGRQVITK
jgi:hypothetical protein